MLASCSDDIVPIQQDTYTCDLDLRSSSFVSLNIYLVTDIRIILGIEDAKTGSSINAAYEVYKKYSHTETKQKDNSKDVIYSLAIIACICERSTLIQHQ